jgi:hypothetical protein
MNNKKGVELSMQTVIVAVILLIILIVCIVIFTKGMNPFNNQTQSMNKGSDCPSGSIKKESCSENEVEIIGNFKAIREGMSCCKLR